MLEGNQRDREKHEWVKLGSDIMHRRRNIITRCDVQDIACFLGGGWGVECVVSFLVPGIAVRPSFSVFFKV